MIDVERRGVLVPFDGGLCSSAQVAALASTGRRVIAVHLDTGSLDPADSEDLIRRGRGLGAERTIVRDVRQSVYDDFLLRLIHAAGPGSADSPAWVAAEDYGLADQLARLAQEVKAEGVVPPLAWSPAAAARVESTLAARLPDLVHTPAESDSATSRRMLESAGLLDLARPAEPSGPYAIRERLWGTLVSGAELDTLDADPDDAVYPNLPPPADAGDLPEEFELELTAGSPRVLFGSEVDGVSLFAQLTRLGRRHSIGRGLLHGPAGRVAYEAPATTLIVAAHQALEAATLDAGRRRLKQSLAQTYVEGFLAGRFHDPVMRDIEAFLDSCQADVSGTVRLQVTAGTVEVLGVRLPNE